MKALTLNNATISYFIINSSVKRLQKGLMTTILTAKDQEAKFIIR